MPKQAESIQKNKTNRPISLKFKNSKRDLEGFRKKDLYRKQQRKEIQISHHKSCMQERMV